MKLKPKIGDFVRQECTPHAGIIVGEIGINVIVRWQRPFWIQDRRIETSTFPRSQAEILSRA